MSEHPSDEQLSLLIDGELSLTARAAVNHHLSACPACAERHDTLVELVAGLRLQPPLRWTPTLSKHTQARLQPRPHERDRALPIALALAIAAAAAAALWLPLAIGPGFARALFDVADSLLPGVLPGHTAMLALLAAIAALGGLAYPLARSR